MAADSSQDDDGAGLDTRLNQETGVIHWTDLVRHFARGVVINVTESLDLIDVAACLARDDTVTLQRWLDESSLRRASDDDARDWTEREPEFWCVVTAPWVLVQEKRPDELHGTTQRVVH
jgi:hypothetical protein